MTYGELRTTKEKALDAELKERVLRGIEALKDTYGEDFASQIDCSVLDMRDPSFCVLGQLEGGYVAGCRRLGLSSEFDSVRDDDDPRSFDERVAARYGFTLVGDDYEIGDMLSEESLPWDALQEAWEEAIC